MPLTSAIKEKISLEVIKTLASCFEGFPEDVSNNRNEPFRKAFLNVFSNKLYGKVFDTPFFISLSSWLHGLNTTLGQTFFEKTAHYLCNGEKREYTSKKCGNLQITQAQKDYITTIITDLSNSAKVPNLNDENSKILRNYDTTLVSAIDFSADVFFENSDSIVAIEMKSVKPNSGEMRGEKQKILEGKAALYRCFPDKQIFFFLGFPFDPTVDPKIESVTSFNKARFMNSSVNMNKYIDPNETLIANELWDFLSGTTNTMEEILEIINTIATTSFLDKFNILLDNAKRTTSIYLDILQEWNMISEMELIQKDAVIHKKITNNHMLTRWYNKLIFDNTYNYNWERYNALIK